MLAAPRRTITMDQKLRCNILGLLDSERIESGVAAS
jgi:hypothetical protein